MKYLILLLLGLVLTFTAISKPKEKKQAFTFFKELPFKFENDYAGKTDSILKTQYKGAYNLELSKYDKVSREYSFTSWYLEYSKPFIYNLTSFQVTTNKDGLLTSILFMIDDTKENKTFQKLLLQNSKKNKSSILDGEYVYIIDNYEVSIIQGQAYQILAHE